MYFRIFSLSFCVFLLSACMDSSEPSEFDQIRMKMEKRQHSNFGNSVKNLENRKNMFQWNRCSAVSHDGT